MFHVLPSFTVPLIFEWWPHCSVVWDGRVQRNMHYAAFKESEWNLLFQTEIPLLSLRE